MAKLGPVKYLTIHCAATPEGRDVQSREIIAWDKAKFGMISYHWIVLLSGAKIRCLQDTELGAHVGKHNTGNIGICYVGGVNSKLSPKDTRTPQQKVALKQLVDEYKRQYPGIIVRGHRDWPNVNKACPSFDVATEL